MKKLDVLHGCDNIVNWVPLAASSTCANIWDDTAARNVPDYPEPGSLGWRKFSQNILVCCLVWRHEK